MIMKLKASENIIISHKLLNVPEMMVSMNNNILNKYINTAYI